MDSLAILNNFLEKASKDARISIAHIGLYSVLFNCWQQQGCEGPVRAYAAQIMRLSKVSSSATFHRLIRQLNEYGYMSYQPSFYKNVKSCFMMDSQNIK